MKNRKTIQSKIFSKDDTITNENKHNKNRFKFSHAWKKRYIPIIASLSAAFIISLTLVFIIPTNKNISGVNEPSPSTGWQGALLLDQAG